MIATAKITREEIFEAVRTYIEKKYGIIPNELGIVIEDDYLCSAEFKFELEEKNESKN